MHGGVSIGRKCNFALNSDYFLDASSRFDFIIRQEIKGLCLVLIGEFVGRYHDMVFSGVTNMTFKDRFVNYVNYM